MSNNNENETDKYGYKSGPLDIDKMSDMDALLMEKTTEYLNFLREINVLYLVEVQSPIQKRSFYSFSSFQNEEENEEDLTPEQYNDKLVELSKLTSVIGGHISKMTQGILMVGPTKYFHVDDQDDQSFWDINANE